MELSILVDIDVVARSLAIVEVAHVDDAILVDADASPVWQPCLVGPLTYVFHAFCSAMFLFLVTETNETFTISLQLTAEHQKVAGGFPESKYVLLLYWLIIHIDLICHILYFFQSI